MPNLPPMSDNKPKHVKPKKLDKDDMIYSSRWGKLRGLYKEHNPICQRCIYLNQLNQKSTERISVHHIYKRLQYPQYAFDMDKLLSLCDECHHKYFDSLERGKVDMAMKHGRQIKADRYIEGNRIALIGNVNAGKSAYIEQMVCEYPLSYKVLQIDAYRRKHNRGHTWQGEEIARHEFIHDVKNSGDCIVVCIGYGKLWRQIEQMIDEVALVQCDSDACYERYVDTPMHSRPPVPIEWGERLVDREGLRMIGEFHKGLNVSRIFNGDVL
jgi:hypothetical protein